MGKRSSTLKSVEISNPYYNAKKRRKAGQAEEKAQHTTKYYVWELLKEKPEGRTVQELVHEMEIRKMRSFANCSKPASQLSVELNRDKEHFTQNAVSRLWSLRFDFAPVVPTNGEAASKDGNHAAAGSFDSPLAQQTKPGALSKEQPDSGIPDEAPAGSPQPEAGPASMTGANQDTQASVSVEQPKEASRSALEQAAPDHRICEASPTQHMEHADPVPSQPQQSLALELQPRPAAALRPSGSIRSQPPEGRPDCHGSAHSERILEAQPGSCADASPGTAAISPRFVLSPRTGVFRAVDPSPASPVSDVDGPASWQELATSALSGSKHGASPLRPAAQQRTSEEQAPLGCGSGAAPARAVPCSQGEQARQQAAPHHQEQVPESSFGPAVGAGGDRSTQLLATGTVTADMEAKPARGELLPDEDLSLQEDTVVRWVPSPEWVGSNGEPGEQLTPGKESMAPPLLGTLPEWPFVTFFPPTPERTVQSSLRTQDQAQPLLPEPLMHEQPPWSPDLLEASYGVPVLPQCRPVQPVQLLGDGEHPPPGSAAHLPAVAPLSTAGLPRDGGPLGSKSLGLPFLSDTLPGSLSKSLPPPPLPTRELPGMGKAVAPIGSGALHASAEPLSDGRQQGAGSAMQIQEQKEAMKHPGPVPGLERHGSKVDHQDGQQWSCQPNRDRRHGTNADGGGHSRHMEGDLLDGERQHHDTARDIDVKMERQQEQEGGRERRGSRDRDTGTDGHLKRSKGARERDDRRAGGYRSSRQEDSRHHRRDDDYRGGHRDDYHDDYHNDYRKSQRRDSKEDRRPEAGRGSREGSRDDYPNDYRDSKEERRREAGRARRRGSRDDYHNDHRESRRSESKEERRHEAGRGSREGSGLVDMSREVRRSKGRDATQEREHERGPSRHASAQPRSRSGTRDSATPDEDWPFDAGRIIPCSEAAAADCLLRMKFGSDVPKDLEGVDKRTALFLWDYERGKLHGIFSGNSKGVEETKSKNDYFLYEVKVKEYAHYHSLPLDIIRRIIPSNGTTAKGQQLLKMRIDRGHVMKLCREYVRNH